MTCLGTEGDVDWEPTLSKQELVLQALRGKSFFLKGSYIFMNPDTGAGSAALPFVAQH